jgi:hypothetical protein
MITWLPVKSFVKSMEFLDTITLDRQRIEAAMILEILTNQTFLPSSQLFIAPFNRRFIHWDKSPAVYMWRGYEEWLKLYLACAIGEHKFRGKYSNIATPKYDTSLQEPPEWLGVEELHASHRSNLIRRLPTHYLKLWPEELLELPYYWPQERKDEGLAQLDSERNTNDSNSVLD